MATDQLTYSGTLCINTCWCGIRHAIPEQLNRHVNEGGEAYCPLGHSYIRAGKTDTQRLREERASAEARESALRDQLDASERSKRALKGVVTRTKRRIGKGVCPCCNRHFANVERHMDSQHPEYADQP